jgi:hypothetical protein
MSSACAGRGHHRWPVLQNSAGSEKSLPSDSVAFSKIQKKIVENQKNSVEMQLTCEMNNKFLEIRNLAELTELSAEFADNSAKFFENSVTEYRPV